MAENYSFGYWVLRRRKALDLTREQLARQVGCATETIKKIERDERRPSLQIAELLADTLAVPTEERERFLKSARGVYSVDSLHFVSEPLSPSARLHNLPPQLTPFIGRENELATINRLLADPACRLLTILGPGGMGKTRIAVQVMKILATDKPVLFPDGLYFIPLAAVSDIQGIIYAITQALRTTFYVGERSLSEQLLNFLSNKQMLLVLDNFEHLINEESIQWLVEMLSIAPAICLLVTSRSRLNILGEQVYSLDGLDNTDLKDDTQVLNKEAGFSASLQLFAQTARWGQPTFQLNEKNLISVVKICQLVEGIPLAIELSASWSGLLEPEEILARLQENLNLLEMESLNLPERQQSVRAVFNTSWRLLRTQERAAVQRIAVFRSGFTVEAAEQVADISIQTLQSVLNKSWIKRDDEGRFQMHELTRRYSLEQLQHADEQESIQARHLNFYSKLAEQSYARIWEGSEQIEWLQRLDQETGNLEAAIKWGAGQRRVQSVEKALYLVGGLYSYLWHRGRIVEGLQWAEITVEAAQNLPVHPAALGKALLVAGAFALFHAQMGKAESYVKASLEANRLGGEPGGISHALLLAGLVAANRNEPRKAKILFQEGLQISRSIESSWVSEYILKNLAELAWSNGDFDQAYDLFWEALDVARQMEDRLGHFNVLIGLGRLSLQLKKLNEAATYSRESMALSTELESPREKARALRLQAAIAFQEGRINEARIMLAEGLSIAWEIGDFRHALFVLEDLALQVAEQGNPKSAVQLLAACQVAYLRFGLLRSPSSEQEISNSLEHLKLELGTANFQQAWEDGHQLSWEQALRIAGG